MGVLKAPELDYLWSVLLTCALWRFLTCALWRMPWVVETKFINIQQEANSIWIRFMWRGNFGIRKENVADSNISGYVWRDLSQHPRASKYAIKFERWIDKLTFKRLRRSTFCERDLMFAGSPNQSPSTNYDLMSNHVILKPVKQELVAGDVQVKSYFCSRNEMWK